MPLESHVRFSLQVCDWWEWQTHDSHLLTLHLCRKSFVMFFPTAKILRCMNKRSRRLKNKLGRWSSVSVSTMSAKATWRSADKIHQLHICSLDKRRLKRCLAMSFLPFLVLKPTSHIRGWLPPKFSFHFPRALISASHNLRCWEIHNIAFLRKFNVRKCEARVWHSHGSRSSSEKRAWLTEQH